MAILSRSGWEVFFSPQSSQLDAVPRCPKRQGSAARSKPRPTKDGKICRLQHRGYPQRLAQAPKPKAQSLALFFGDFLVPKFRRSRRVVVFSTGPAQDLMVKALMWSSIAMIRPAKVLEQPTGSSASLHVQRSGTKVWKKCCCLMFIGWYTGWYIVYWMVCKNQPKAVGWWLSHLVGRGPLPRPYHPSIARIFPDWSPSPRCRQVWHTQTWDLQLLPKKPEVHITNIQVSYRPLHYTSIYNPL